MKFTPRDYQQAIISHIVSVPRCAVWAGMGCGKSVSTLTALLDLSMIEDVFPVLIVAPLRVAQSTWPDEVRKWDHTSGLRVSAIVGEQHERLLALTAKAEIYTINYENLPWLRDTLGKKWPFRTVVADEATKLKGFRIRQGSERANALAKFAHKRCSRFIELTGTPSPNGLNDLWGQAWFLDRGYRLGWTYTAFVNRWFQLKHSGYGLQPLPHTQAEIQGLMRDLCITISAGDYLDLPPLIENEIRVDLPPTARKLYEDMEKKMFAQIGEHDVEAFNAAARTNKCLQLANGAVYYDDTGSWTSVHQAKMDALDDILEEAAGMPVLVAYQFQSDLARLKQRFGNRARHLDKDPQTLRDWNAGQIPMLLAHPASAGHGLNLQDGGNILAYFSSGWNLEEDQQILERIGPTRQAQSGHNRPVFVHRIVARNTVDELVAIARDKKATVQQVLLDYMKKKEAA